MIETVGWHVATIYAANNKSISLFANLHVEVGEPTVMKTLQESVIGIDKYLKEI